MRVHDTQIDKFTEGYITCLLFITSEYEFPEYCYSGEFGISKEDADRFTGDALMQVIDDCSKFQEQNEALLEQTHGDDLQNGMDFCYDRSRCGVGFTDRAYDYNWSEDVAKQLKQAAQNFGEINLFKVGCNCYEELGDGEQCVCGDETKIDIG